MSDDSKKFDAAKEADAFEMIEMAIDDISSLTRAFDLINTICTEANNPELIDDCDEQPKLVLN